MVNGATTASDLELLREYAQSACAQAFAQLVRRHVGWVHAASLRQLNGDAHLAEDVTQAVFILLARRAATLPEGTLLTGWLFNTARYAAAEARRKAARRRKHEARAAITAESPDPDSEDHAWRRLAPLLDETITLLRESERQAVLLRYFENKSFEEIAVAMGINEAAARKRVSRGVKRLREVFVNRGVIAPAVAVLTLLLTRAAGAAPAASFAQAVATTAIRVGPPHALALSIVRQTTLRMLRARQRLAAAIVACAGVAFLGLWALLIASMLEPDAPEIADLIDPFDATGSAPELVLLAPDRLPLDAPTLRADWTANRPPRRPRDASSPRTPGADRPPLDTFWRLRGDLDPRNGPSASARPNARPQLPVRHDRDYDDAADTYASYAGMGGGGGGGGGGSGARDPNNPRNRTTPGQVNVTVSRGNADPAPQRTTHTSDRIRTASASSADNLPAQSADKPTAPFRGNPVELMQQVLRNDNDRNAPFRSTQGYDNSFHHRGFGGPRGSRGPTDLVKQAVEPYPSNLPNPFGPATGTVNFSSDGSTRGSGATLYPVIARDGAVVTSSLDGMIAFAPHTVHPAPTMGIYWTPGGGGPIQLAPLVLPAPPATVPEPGTGLLAAAAAAIALSLRSRRSIDTRRSRSLVTQHRPQRPHDLRQLPLRPHDRVHILVRPRRFVPQHVRAATVKPDPAHLPLQLPHRDRPPRLVTRHRPPRPAPCELDPSAASHPRPST